MACVRMLIIFVNSIFVKISLVSEISPFIATDYFCSPNEIFGSRVGEHLCCDCVGYDTV